MGMSDKDKGLRGNGDLEIDDHVELGIIVISSRRCIAVSKGDTEFVEEPCRSDNARNKGNTIEILAKAAMAFWRVTYVERVSQRP